MSLLFGDLTQAFVNFGSLSSGEFGPATPEQIHAAGQQFLHVASVDAAYLVLIGPCSFNLS